MFYDGDLQSGIAAALQRDVPVVCFVKDASPESSEWENDWLQAEDISSVLTENAVPLRLEADSKEAGFLSAFCTIAKTPNILVIYNGRLLEQLNSGTTQDEFSTRLLRALVNDSASISAAESSATQSQGGESRGPDSDATDHALPAEQREAAATQHDTPSSTVQKMLDERRKRLETQRKQQEETEKAERAARKKAQLDADEAETAAKPRKASQVSYASEQVQRKREARQERERILRVIENDKLERKEKEERRRALAKAEAEAERDAENVDGVEALAQTRTSKSASGSTCAVQVRFSDGTTIRSIFDAKSTIAAEVRQWIGEQRTDGNAPYVLKQILLPPPSRTLSDEEEAETLQSLGLAPSATLIIVPVQGYVTSYAGSGSGFFGAIYSTLAGVLALVVEYIKYFLGIGQTAQAATPVANGSIAAQRQQQQTSVDGTTDPDSSSSTTATGSSIRIRTLNNRKNEKDKQQLYNGNQLNFEPNEKDANEEDESGR